ncbi:hypothetical protein [uncultured Ruegeria sp.]|uniref:hypothetical protein n=1 Tax=uncultured Ruegeria sp. TaxID=259304 RepID=UPI002618C12B|nr:hypothetical protein [uncultured Ruegeria sp.]
MIRCIQISPYIFAQGRLIARHPHTNEATIRCSGALLRGVLIPTYRYGEVEQ